MRPNWKRDAVTFARERADLRARILRLLANAGAEGMLVSEACDTLVTRAKRGDIQEEGARMVGDGLVRREGASRAQRWVITDAGHAASKAAA